MTDIWNWVVSLPENFAKFGVWLGTPLAIKWQGITYMTLPSPLVMAGIGLVGVIASIIILRAIHLINPLG